MREIVRSYGLSVERIVPEDAPAVTTAPVPPLPPETPTGLVENGRDIAALTTTSPNFGNE